MLLRITQPTHKIDNKYVHKILYLKRNMYRKIIKSTCQDGSLHNSNLQSNQFHQEAPFTISKHHNFYKLSTISTSSPRTTNSTSKKILNNFLSQLPKRNYISILKNLISLPQQLTIALCQAGFVRLNGLLVINSSIIHQLSFVTILNEDTFFKNIQNCSPNNDSSI